MEKKLKEYEVVSLRTVHHHFGDVLAMVAAGKTVYIRNAVRNVIVAVLTPPTLEQMVYEPISD